MRRVFLLIAALWAGEFALSQNFLSGTTAIRAALEDLSSDGRVMMIAAHPDDERNNLIAYLARGRHIRTEYLSLTRGEGGQNAIGSEQGYLLGVIRTQELLAARRIDGGTQSFSSAVDFGFSKSAEETLRKWNREVVLGDIVQRIRAFQPDTVILRWTGTPADGHGHHQASAILGKEGIQAAADPARFPAAGKPWQVKQTLMYLGKKAPGAVAVPVNGFDPELGYAFNEIGAISRSQHRSQAMGTGPEEGPAVEYLTPTATLPETATIPEELRRAKSQFRAEQPQAIIPLLQELHGKGWKPAEVAEVIALCAGLRVRALVDKPYIQPGQSTPLHIRIGHAQAVAVELVGQADRVWRADADQTSVAIDLKIAGQPIQLTRPIEYRYVDKILGERTRPVAVVPAVGVRFAEPTVLFGNTEPRTIHLAVQSFTASAKGVVSIRLPNGWSSSPDKRTFDLPREGAEAMLQFQITPPAKPETLDTIALVDGAPATNVVVTEYPHIPTQTTSLPAAARFVRANTRVLARKVGYVMGAGDAVPDSIRQMGCEIVFLSSEDLATGDLEHYDAIVTGVRAFNLREDLRAARERLNEYVRTGGTMVVQYNTLDGLSGPLGPYPIQVGRGRVSVEEAPVRILKPSSVLLRGPNEITPADFNGWVQERGLYFPSKWDPHYEAVIASNDPGESSLEGGILFLRYGEGVYIYTSYSWFRQLPAGVPGAYRLFANMLSQ